ncbi:MAG TPA: hypothetical protein VK578_15790 [Edaphobacter sp.]|nr:hypothetical protein [Edaphobacter sp.]
MVYNQYAMQTIPASLRISLPPQKRKTSGVAVATAAYAFLQLSFKLVWPSTHEHSETLFHLVGEVAFQTILFAIFFTFLRFALPRNKRNSAPLVNENHVVPVNTSLQLRDDPATEYKSPSPALAGATSPSRN